MAEIVIDEGVHNKRQLQMGAFESNHFTKRL